MIQITIYNTSCRIVVSNAIEQDVTRAYLGKFHTEMDFINRKPNKPAEVKATFYTHKGPNLYIHTNALTDYMTFVVKEGIPPAGISVIKEDVNQGKHIDVELLPSIKLRDYQLDAINFVHTKSEFKAKLLALPTGSGKTFTALSYIPTIKRRTLITMRPSYIKQWKTVIPTVLNIDDTDILHIKSGATLKKVCTRLLTEDIDTKIVIISNKLLQVMTTKYVTSTEDEPYMYDVSPVDLFVKLNIGLVIMDEVHQDINIWYKMMSMVKMPKVVALSATFYTRSPIIKRIQKQMFPLGSIYDLLEVDPYVIYDIYKYTLNNPNRYRTTPRGRNSYNHLVYEESLSRNLTIWKKYLEMIFNIVVSRYINSYQKGDKCIIFVSRVDTAKNLTEYFLSRYPSASITSYIGGSDYQDILDNEIIISTTGKGGTALDIPGLVLVVNTVNVMSIQLNIQMLGRLRKRKDGRTTFIQVISNSIAKHRGYQIERDMIFSNKLLKSSSRLLHKAI